MQIYKVLTLSDGSVTIGTERTVTHEQGSWEYQVRLWTAYYRAHYSKRLKAWIWKCYDHSGCYSGGNIRGNHWNGDGGIHNAKLAPIDLWALATVLGDN